jgi:hypothetical protein
MKRKHFLGLCLGLILCSATAALADGDFYGGGPWGNIITKLPYTISTPGCYYLNGNLSYAGGNGITIASSDVTLDLMGFTLTGPGDANNGILIPDGTNNVEIRNGTVTYWDFGISSLGGVGHRVLNIRAERNRSGVSLSGTGHVIQSCRATAGLVSFIGLHVQAGGRISGCVTENFGQDGINGNGIISDNVVIGPGLGSIGYGGIWAGSASLIKGNYVNNATRGIHCFGPASVIGNTVITNPGQTGIHVDNNNTTCVSQNNVQGDGTHYSAHDLVTAWRTNY